MKHEIRPLLRTDQSELVLCCVTHCGSYPAGPQTIAGSAETIELSEEAFKVRQITLWTLLH